MMPGIPVQLAHDLCDRRQGPPRTLLGAVLYCFRAYARESIALAKDQAAAGALPLKTDYDTLYEIRRLASVALRAA
jgi:hypothetical protein